jgi:hypothetical protein
MVIIVYVYTYSFFVGKQASTDTSKKLRNSLTYASCCVVGSDGVRC